MEWEWVRTGLTISETMPKSINPSIVLCECRPLLKRQKSSFLRSFRSKPRVTKLRREVQASLRRRAVRVSEGAAALHWWQQSSIDSNNSEDK